MKKKILLIVVNALCLLALAGCIIASVSIREPLTSQRAAKAWAGQSGERFAQLSVFMPEGLSLNLEGIYGLRESIDKALTAASLDADENKEADAERILYTDAWSAESEVSVGSESASAAAGVIGVGGDFFLFHPLRLRDGSYLHPDDLMKDRVVLDEELAWRLFGSIRIAGFEVTIEGKPHVIAGVVSREDDFSSKKVYSGDGGLFMTYESLQELLEEPPSISCYEIVMPDLISGFALKTLTDAFPHEDAHFVENSARFSLSNSFKTIAAFGERSISAGVIVYPHWESAARYAEDWLALLLALSVLLILFPLVCGVVYVVKAVRLLIKRGKRSVAKKIEQRDERQAEEYLLKNIEESVTHSIDDIVRELLEEEKPEDPKESL